MDRDRMLEPAEKKLANTLLEKIKEGSRGFQRSFVLGLSEEEFHVVANRSALLSFLSYRIQRQCPCASVSFVIDNRQLCFDATE